jgi:hypothetical protein
MVELGGEGGIHDDGRLDWMWINWIDPDGMAWG